MFSAGDHGSTYGGQPFAASAARATLAELRAIDAPARAASAGERLRAGLEALPAVASVRGLGLLLAAELSDRPAKAAAASLLEAGLVVNAVTDTALRFAPPLNVSDDDIDEAVALCAAVLA